MAYKAKIVVQGGKGGSGVVSFRRESHVPRGGPNGGSGGRGGSVIFVGDDSLNDLIYFERSRGVFKASDGSKGSGNNSNGKSGDDILIKVPLVTEVYEMFGSGRSVLGYLIDDGAKLNVASGGRGGLGNAKFSSSVNKEPLLAESGSIGESVNIGVDMLIDSDVFLVGPPNSGKSSLVGRLTNAKVTIADYPFSTTYPVKGAIPGDSFPIVFFDTPPVVKGSCLGKAFGLDFVSHAQLAGIVTYVVDASDEPVDKFECILSEISQYDESVLSKQSLILLSKIDLVQNPSAVKAAEQSLSSVGQVHLEKFLGVVKTSTLLGYGLDDFTKHVRENLKSRKERMDEFLAAHPAQLKASPEYSNPLAVRSEEGVYEITHAKCLRLAGGSRLEDWDTLLQFRSFMDGVGVVKKLYELGIRAGNLVRVGDKEFVWE